VLSPHPANSMGLPCCKEEAPYLAEFFKLQQETMSKTMADPLAMMEKALTKGGMQKMKQEQLTWFRNVGTPLLEKSFKHHDSGGSGTLTQEEAQVFFEHLISKEVAMYKAVAVAALQKTMLAMAEMMKGMGMSDNDEKAKMKEEIAEVNQKFDEKMKKYWANKASCDAAAFKVLDTNGDGTIQLAEFISVFEPESPRNMEFHLALGLTDEQEARQQRKSQQLRQSLKGILG